MPTAVSWGFAGLWIVLVVAGCGGAAQRPSDAEIHGMAAASIGEELGAAGPLLLHPLLIQYRPGESQTLERSTFNAYDSASVPAIVEGRPLHFALCETTPAGMCDVPEGGVAVVLSEMDDLGRNGVGVGALAVDNRTGRPDQRYFMMRVKGRRRGWEVVEVKELR